VIIKQVVVKRSSYRFLDSTWREFCISVGRERLEVDIYTLQGEDAFSRQRTGNNVQARYCPITGMPTFGKLRPTAMRPVLNAVEERVHRIPQLIEIATREELSTLLEERRALLAALLLLSSGLLSLQPRSATCLKRGARDSSESSDDGAQQATDRTRHTGRIASGLSLCYSSDHVNADVAVLPSS
jgi:hypothetical protein